MQNSNWSARIQFNSTLFMPHWQRAGFFHGGTGKKLPFPRQFQANFNRRQQLCVATATRGTWSLAYTSCETAVPFQSQDFFKGELYFSTYDLIKV